MSYQEGRQVKDVVNDWVEHPYTKAAARFAMIGWSLFGTIALYFVVPQYIEMGNQVGDHSVQLAVIHAERARGMLDYAQFKDDVKVSVRTNTDAIAMISRAQAADEALLAEHQRRLDRVERR